MESLAIVRPEVVPKKAPQDILYPRRYRMAISGENHRP